MTNGENTNPKNDYVLLNISPCSLREANEFVSKFHRHHKPTAGHKFSIKCVDDTGNVVGVAICGRPVSRYLDDGNTLEINRLCTDGTRNACSKLYGACAKIARAMGYKKIITYILESESGISLKASGFICEGTAGGEIWTGKRSGRDNGVPRERKTRWSKTFQEEGNDSAGSSK